MPDKETVTLKLPSGESVDFVVPGGMSDSEVKTYVLSKRPDLFQPKTLPPIGSSQGSIGPTTNTPITDPQSLGTNLGEKTSSYLQQAQNLTPQGAQAHPVQNIIGKLAGLAVGGSQGIGSEGHGILTSPVTGPLIGLGPGGSVAEAAASKLPGAVAAAERASAGKTIGEITETAGKIPVNTGKFGDALLELYTNKGYGAQLPTPAKNLLNRLVAKDAAPLTLEEAKGFQGQLTKFLQNPVDQFGAKIKDPNTFRLVGQLNQGLKDSIEEASQVGGFDPGTFTGAMQHFSDAAKKEAMIARLHDLATKGIKIGVGGAVGGAAAGLGYDLYKLVHGTTNSGGSSK